jgi:hypothetical protein
MKVEIVEKRDNEVVVKFMGQSPLDATLMAIVKLGLTTDSSSLTSTSYNGSTRVSFGTVAFEVIDAMQPAQEEDK